MFGARLKELREQLHYSMDKMIEEYNKKYDAKMNKSTLSRYENGLQDPIYTVVVNLADFFGVTVDYISGGTDTGTSAEHRGDITFDDFTYAMFNESRKLSAEDKEMLLSFARRLRERVESESIQTGEGEQ